jgi:septum site-determining protein MinC
LKAVVTGAPQPQQLFRFRNRSFMAFVLAPEPPIANWLAELENWTRSAPGFFVGRPVVLDLAAVTLSEPAVAHLITELSERQIRIIGIEGVDPPKLGPQLPPVLTGGCPAAEDRTLDPPSNPSGSPPPRQEPASLLLESTVRSGQTVIFPYGDVTVLGSVASGAELVAGGSIHVYGTLRGRAMAGSRGNSRARIFCSRNEAELLAIDGSYRIAEDIDDNLRSRPVQAWLDVGGLMIAALG